MHAGVMLDQRRRRWASIEPALGQRLVFAGISQVDVKMTLAALLASHMPLW